MTKVYIVQMRGPEWETIKKVFYDEKDAVDYCKDMNVRNYNSKDVFKSLSTYGYIAMEVV